MQTPPVPSGERASRDPPAAGPFEHPHLLCARGCSSQAPPRKSPLQKSRPFRQSALDPPLPSAILPGPAFFRQAPPLPAHVWAVVRTWGQ